MTVQEVKFYHPRKEISGNHSYNSCSNTGPLVVQELYAPTHFSLVRHVQRGVRGRDRSRQQEIAH